VTTAHITFVDAGIYFVAVLLQQVELAGIGRMDHDVEAIGRLHRHSTAWCELWRARKLDVLLDADETALRVVQRPSLSHDGETLFRGLCAASAGNATSTLRTTSAATFIPYSSVDCRYEGGLPIFQ
jgi:hypothetical protein